MVEGRRPDAEPDGRRRGRDCDDRGSRQRVRRSPRAERRDVARLRTGPGEDALPKLRRRRGPRGDVPDPGRRLAKSPQIVLTALAAGEVLLVTRALLFVEHVERIEGGV